MPANIFWKLSCLLHKCSKLQLWLTSALGYTAPAATAQGPWTSIQVERLLSGEEEFIYAVICRPSWTSTLSRGYLVVLSNLWHWQERLSHKWLPNFNNTLEKMLYSYPMCKFFRLTIKWQYGDSDDCCKSLGDSISSTRVTVIQLKIYAILPERHPQPSPQFRKASTVVKVILEIYVQDADSAYVALVGCVLYRAPSVNGQASNIREWLPCCRRGGSIFVYLIKSLPS